MRPMAAKLPSPDYRSDKMDSLEGKAIARGRILVYWDAVAPALLGTEPLAQGLKRYRRRHARGLRGHAALMYDYAGGRKISPPERLLFSSAARDERLARTFEAFGTRSIGPARMFATTVPRAVYVNTRHALAQRGGRGSGAVEAESA